MPWTHKSALISIFAIISVAAPVSAHQNSRLDRAAVNLTEPINIQNCVDGQPFSARILDEHELNLPPNTTFSGHLHIVTTDSRASKNQLIELRFETLNLAERKIPIVCRLDTIGPNLKVTHEGKKKEFPSFCFRTPNENHVNGPLCILSASREELRKIQKAELKEREKLALANKEAAIWNKRHGLTNSNQIYFASTKGTPFNIETTDRLRVKIYPPVEIPDCPLLK